MPALEHPSPADLQAYAVGALSDDAARAVESHLAECPECLAVAVAAPDDTLVTLLRSAETSQAGPVTPGSAFAETVGLSRADTSVPTNRPTALADHPKYRLIRPLGRGGMGHVWLAEHTLMNRPVALKLVRPEFLDRPEAVERFRREVRAAAKLNHANIVAAHDAEQAGGTHFLVMEYIDGETLAERIEAGPVSIADACRWTIDAARGLDHARTNGLIHRDVKPHNLILERATGRVKVLDFGLAGVAAGERSGLTGGNVVIGTPDYIAPEQAEDARTADTRSDVYSLGCTLYHLLAGRPPFGGESVLKKLDAHRNQQAQSLTAIRQDMTPALAELVARMLAKDPADRPQTPREVAAALEDILAGRGSGDPPVRARRLRDDGGRGRRSVWIGISIATAVAALLGFGIYVFLVIPRLTTGTLVIQTDANDDVRALIRDKEIQIVVKDKASHEVVRVIDLKSETSVTLPGSTFYELELRAPEGLRLSANSFGMRKGEEFVVLIERVAQAETPRLARVETLGRQDLVATGPAAPADSGWSDLIPLVDPIRDTELGKLTRSDGPKPTLHVKSDLNPNARVRLPFLPTASYEVRAAIARVHGDDSFVLVLPIPGGPGITPHVSLCVDASHQDGEWTELKSVDGVEFAEPMRRTFGGRLERDKTYPLYVRVTVVRDKVAIRAELAGKVVFDWSDQAKQFYGGRDWVGKDNTRLAVGAVAGEFRVEQLEARMMPVQAVAPAPLTLIGRPDGPWTDLLALVDASLDRESGTITKSYEGDKTVVVVDPGTGRLARVAVPVRPEGDYELRTRITRLTGADSFNLMLPVPGTNGRSQIGVRIDTVQRADDAVVRLDWPGGFAQPLAKTKLRSNLKRGQAYHLFARVTTAKDRVRVRVEANSIVVLEWDGPLNEVRDAAVAFTDDRRRVGFGASASEFRVDGFEFRMLSGSAAIGRPDLVPKAPEGPRELVGKPDAPWTDLFKGLSLPVAIVDGTWGWSGDVQKVSLVAGNPNGKGGRLALPVWPKGDYELRIRFARTDGEECLVALLPIPTGSGATPLFVDLRKLDKHQGAPLVASLGSPLTNKTVYTLLVRVSAADGRASVRAQIDDEQVLELSGRIADFPVSADSAVPDPGQLGLGVRDNCRFRIDSVEFRPLTGTAVWGIAAGARVAEKPGSIRRFGRYKGAIRNFVLSRDGSALFVADAGLSRWKVSESGMAWSKDDTTGGVVALSGDETVLMTWGHDGFARVVNLKTGEIVRKFAIPPEQVGHAILNKDGSRAVLSTLKTDKGVKPTVSVWDVPKGTELFALVGNMDDTYGLALSPDGTRLATASYDKNVRLWDATTGQLLHTFRGHTAGVSAVTFSADGKYLVSGGGDHAVRVWSVEEKRGASVLLGHTEWITDVAFTPDGNRVVSVSGYEGKGDGIRVWDWRAGEQMHHYAEARGQLVALAVMPDGQRAVTGAAEGTVRVWRLPGPVPPRPETVGPVRRFGRFNGSVSAVSLSQDGRFIYSLDEGVVKWDREGEKVVWTQELEQQASYHVVATRDDRHVLAGCADGTVAVLDAATGQVLRRFKKHKEQILSVAVSPDGKRAVSSSGTDQKEMKHSIRVWEVDTAKELFELKGHTDETWSIAFSEDGTRIATASDDGTVRLWDAATGQELHVFRGHKGAASAIAFSPNGKRLVSGGQDLTVRIWDVEKKELLQSLDGHDVWITEVAYTPDGTRILSVGGNWEQELSDGLRVWDAASGKPLYEGVHSGFHAVGLAVFPDSRYAVTGGMDGSIRIWKLPDAPPRK